MEEKHRMTAVFSVFQLRKWACTSLCFSLSQLLLSLSLPSDQPAAVVLSCTVFLSLPTCPKDTEGCHQLHFFSVVLCACVLNCTFDKCTWKRQSWFLNAQRSFCDILNIYRCLCSWLYCASSCVTTNSVYFWKLSGIVFWTDFVTRRL